jgi:parvulin-like peptidyl-prolyl isomerase
VSPDQGRRTIGKGGSGNAPGPAATRRLGLLVFGIAFLALFLIVAISEGVGDPSIPSGNVALVKGAPGDVGEVTKAKFDHALELAVAQSGEKTPPKPGDPKYEELKKATLFSLLESIWLQGVAAEWGVEASEAEIDEELKKVKKESFKSEAEFKKFLKESHYTPADLRERVKLKVLSGGLQEQLLEKAPAPDPSEIENYYEAAKATQFTQKPSRSFRSIVNKDLKKVEVAKEALTKDNSAKNWAKIAKKYSTDPNTKNSGGLQEAVQEGSIEEPLGGEVFSTPEGQVEGPVKGKFGYTIYEVVNSSPESVQDLKTVESQIESTLKQEAEQEYLENFSFEFTEEWTLRTFCASGYVVERCANYQETGHPGSPESCYEPNPKAGLPASCPAPVRQLIPALPGTVSPLEPKGEPLPQRPRPMEEAGKGKGEGAAALPEGAVPPPAEEAPSE